MTMRHNSALAARFAANLAANGVADGPMTDRLGSSDIGNVSFAVPTIHPMLAITDEMVPMHSVAFRDLAATERGNDVAILGATTLAQTAVGRAHRARAWSTRRGRNSGPPDDGAARTQTDEARRDALAGRLFEATIGAFDLLAVQLGIELGLYAALRDGGPATARELAERAGIDARYAREWLEHQAVGGILDVVQCRRTTPTPAASCCRRAMPRRCSTPTASRRPRPCPLFVLAAARIWPDLVAAYRSGEGVDWIGYPGLSEAQELRQPPGVPRTSSRANGSPRSRTWTPGSGNPARASPTSRAAPAGRRSRWLPRIRARTSRASTSTLPRSSGPDATRPRPASATA